MTVCTFFGHRDCPASIKPKLRAVVEELIVRYGVDWFYMGRQGAFDAMARSVLRELAKVYPHISYAVVLELGFSASLDAQGKVYRVIQGEESCLYRIPRYNRPWGVTAEQIITKALGE